jgi:hypothetical protein
MKSAVVLNVVMTSVVAPFVEWNLERKETKGRIKKFWIVLPSKSKKLVLVQLNC